MRYFFCGIYYAVAVLRHFFCGISFAEFLLRYFFCGIFFAVFRYAAFNYAVSQCYEFRQLSFVLCVLSACLISGFMH